MKIRLELFLFFLILLLVQEAHSQNRDNELMMNAKRAMDAYSDYNKALQYLGQVSSSGKSDYTYLALMGRANHGLGYKDEALRYYNMCLSINPNDNQIIGLKQLIIDEREARRLADERREADRKAEIVRAKQEQERKEQERRDEAERLRSISFTDFAGLSLGYSLYPNLNSFSNGSLNLDFSMISGRRFLFEYSIKLNKGLQTNTDWLSDVFAEDVSDFDEVGSGGLYIGGKICGMLYLGSNRFGVAFGPAVGGGGLFLPEVHGQDYLTSYDYDAPDFTVTYGGQFYIFPGNTIYLKAEYVSLFPKKNVTGTIDGDERGTIPLVYDQITLSLGVRISAVY